MSKKPKTDYSRIKRVDFVVSACNDCPRSIDVTRDARCLARSSEGRKLPRPRDPYVMRISIPKWCPWENA